MSLSPLVWLVLPGGAVLLFALLTSLHYIQARLGKSWPDPVFPDMVKNREGSNLIVRARHIEKEEFNSVRIATAHDGPCHNAFVYGTETAALDGLYMKEGLDNKDPFGRTVSVDSGIPPSPQDNAFFSSSDDVFHPDDKESPLSASVYSCTADGPAHPGITMKALGKGGKPKKSWSLSSGETLGSLPAITEDGALDSLAAKYAASALVEDLARASSSGYKDNCSRPNDELHAHSDYSRVSHGLPMSPQQRPQACAIQALKIASDITDKKLIVGSEIHSPPSSPVASSGYVSCDAVYCKMGLHRGVTGEETSGKPPLLGIPERDDCHITYSVLSTPGIIQESPAASRAEGSGSAAVPQGTSEKCSPSSKVAACVAHGTAFLRPTSQTKQSFSSTSPYISKEAMPLSPTGMHGCLQEDVVSSASSSSPLGTPSNCSTEPPDLTNQLADYVRGVDLAVSQSSSSDEETTPLIGSPPFSKGHSFSVYTNEEQMLPLSKDCQLRPVDGTWKFAEGKGFRSRHESSSSSGYVSDPQMLTSKNDDETFLPEPRHVPQYASLAFSSSESIADSDPDSQTNKDSTSGSEPLGTPSESAGSEEHGHPDASFVEYVGQGYPSGEEELMSDFLDTPLPHASQKEGSSPPHGPAHSCTPGEPRNVPAAESAEPQEGDTDRSSCCTRGPAVEMPCIDCRTAGHGATSHYQVPTSKPRPRVSSCVGDDGYVPCGGNSGYVLCTNNTVTNTSLGNGKRDEYIPMSAIVKQV